MNKVKVKTMKKPMATETVKTKTIEFTEEQKKCIIKILSISECLEKINEIAENLVDKNCGDIQNFEHSCSIKHYLACIKVLENHYFIKS